ncbi:MAG: hypothetical protein RLY31_2992 [Bacteroidota bacterium]
MPGNFSISNGILTHIISGTAATGGMASFALTVGGGSCTLNLNVGCGALVDTNEWREFICHNLASADTTANPLQPSWEINGGYWQWGRKGPDPAQGLYTNTPNFAHGPTGPGASQAIEDPISSWSQFDAPDSSWQDGTKTLNDPCPAGFRVPTEAQWQGIVNNNMRSIIGTWSSTNLNYTNYSAGSFFGPAMMLPAARNRGFIDGALFFRGGYGYYCSSTAVGYATNYAWDLSFGSGFAIRTNNRRSSGFSVRCAAE